MNFWDIIWYLTSYLTSQSRLSLLKSQNIRILRSPSRSLLPWVKVCIHKNIKIFRSIRSFVGILTSFEWNFGQFYDLTSYLTSKSRLSLQKVNIFEFWHHHHFPQVKICIFINFQLYLIICWHSNIIWMIFMISDVIFDVTMSS